MAAEWRSVQAGELAFALVDALVGVLVIGCGIVALERRAARRVALLMVLTGFAWFAGNFAPGAVFLHPGPLTHLLLCYPTGRLRHPLQTTSTPRPSTPS